MIFRSNKRGMELSINMLVVIILSIVILIFGIGFLYNVLSKSFQLKGAVDEDLDKQIETILCDKPVCLATTYKKIYRGNFEIIGLRIYNAGDAATFTITVSLNKVFDKNNNDITNTAKNQIYLLPSEPRTVELGSRAEKGVGIGIEIGKNAPSGTYVFNVEVKTNNAIYGTLQQIRVEVP